MKKIEIYHATYCGFCRRALQLLDSKGVNYTDYDVTDDQAGRAEMTKRANGGTSVPQIFIDGQHIGGCDDLHALDASGELDKLLAA